MKSRRFCSVCKQWLDMEIVPTADGDDDGVVWFRCPQCQGCLPKLSAVSAEPGGTASAGSGAAGADVSDSALGSAEALLGDDELHLSVIAGAIDTDDLGVDDDADGDADEDSGEDVDDDAEVAAPRPIGVRAPVTESEPIMEYAAMLAAVDPETSVPYRPWDTYEVGQCVLHLAWNDCGIVVAKEVLPGGRRAIKCFFQGAGVVRLIENAPR